MAEQITEAEPMADTEYAEELASDELQSLLLVYTDDQRAAVEREYLQANEQVREALIRVLKIAAERIGEFLDVPTDGRTRKKARTAGDTAAATAAEPMAEEEGPEICTIRDLACTLPVRKKQHVRIFSSALHITAAAPDGQQADVTLRLPLDQIERVVCVLTPEKVVSTWTFIFVARQQAHMVAFSLVDTHDLEINVFDEAYFTEMAETELSSRQLLLWLFGKLTGKAVEETQATVYVSSKREDCVRCYVGSKEGFLWVLPHGLLFGLKKPITYIDYADVVDLQTQNNGRTSFDLTVQLTDGSSHTFGMIASSEGALAHAARDAWKDAKRADGEEDEEGLDSEEDDSDYAPEEVGSGEEVAEEYEEDYESSSWEEGEEEEEGEEGDGEEEGEGGDGHGDSDGEE